MNDEPTPRWVEAEWVHAEGFRAWIDQRRPEWRTELPDSQRRRVLAMTDLRGAKVSLACADRICCLLFLHISEIPEELWTDRPKKGGGVIHSETTRADALLAVRKGEPVAHVARRLGIGRSTIDTWRKAA